MEKEKNIVVKAWKDEEEGGIIVHKLSRPDEDSTVVEYTTVIGGLSWPTDKSPAYYCILGQLWDGKYGGLGQKKNKGKLVFLSEYQCDFLSLKELFLKMTDDSKKFFCESFYTDTNERWEGYVETFDDYFGEKKLDLKPGIEDASFTDNFLYGVQLIDLLREENKIDIPEDTVIYEQLRKISKDDLGGKPETRFYAVNALRFAVGAFEKCDFRPVIFRSRGKKSGTSWMAK